MQEFLATLALTLATSASFTPKIVKDALDRALVVENARAELLSVKADAKSTCRFEKAEAQSPVAGSGRIAIKLEGRLSGGNACRDVAWANVSVLAKVMVAKEAIRPGELVKEHVMEVEREIHTGEIPLAALPDSSVAGVAVSRGTIIESRHLRRGPSPGESLPVRAKAGAIVVEQAGRAIPCGRNKTCAILPSGRRVEGMLVNGRLEVEIL